MARGIQEGDLTIIHVDAVGADVLCNAAGLTRCYVCMTDGVQNGGLTVVNVTHNDNDRCAGHEICLLYTSRCV